MNKKSTSPVYTTHPGELILDELRERKMTQRQLAELSGIKTSILSETIHGKRAISLNMAVALEKALGISADYWMSLQTQYNIDNAAIQGRKNKKETVSVTIPASDIGLLKEIAHKFGWACLF